MVPDLDLQRWRHAINGITASQDDLSSEERSAFRALTEFINNDNFETSESSAHIQTLKNCATNNGILKKVHLANFIALSETHFHPPIPVIVPPPKTPPEDSTEKTPPEETPEEAPPPPKQLKPVFDPPSLKKNSTWNDDDVAQKIVTKGPTPFLTWIIIAGIVVLMGCSIAVRFILKNKSQKETAKQEQLATTPTDTPPTKTTTVNPEQPDKKRSGRLQPSIELPPPPAPIKNNGGATATDVFSSGTVAVSGGSYSGELKNGVPHGQGTINYNSHSLIDPNDPKQRYAEEGQSITGRFKEGRLLQGKLSDSDGNLIEIIIIGGGAF